MVWSYYEERRFESSTTVMEYLSVERRRGRSG